MLTFDERGAPARTVPASRMDPAGDRYEPLLAPYGRDIVYEALEALGVVSYMAAGGGMRQSGTTEE